MPRRVLFLLLTLLGVMALPQRVRTAADGAGYEVTNTGWAKHHVAVPDSLNCPNGLELGGFDTQTDVKKRWASGDIEQAVVTYSATSTGNKTVACGAASGATFTPTNPSVTAVFKQRTNATYIDHGHFVLTKSGTHDNAVTRHYLLACKTAAGAVSFPSGSESVASNTTLDATNKVIVDWNADVPTDDCDNIVVYRGTSAATAQQICDVARTDGLCDDTGQAASGAYPVNTDDDLGITHTFTLPAFGVATGCLVNGVEAVGQTVIAADTCTGTIRWGDEVSFAGQTQRYRVVSALAAGSFTVYPELKAEAADNAAITVHEWLTGQHVRETRYCEESDNAGLLKTLLRVCFDMRHFSDVTYQVDVQVNNIFDRVDLTALVYDVEINVAAGAVEFARDGYYHFGLRRWHKTFDSATFDPAVVVPDFEHYKSAKLIPTYHTDIVDTAWAAPDTSEGAAYDIDGYGSLGSGSMNAGGLRPEIGFLNTYAAQYSVHYNAAQRAVFMADGDISGSWESHVTRSDGGTITWTETASYWADLSCRRAAPNGLALCTTTSKAIYGVDTNDSANWDCAHNPTLNYVPALLTGDRWHYDEVRHWTAWALLWFNANLSAVPGTMIQGEQRGLAWCLRKLWHANALLDDNDPDMPEFATRLDLNMDGINAIDDTGASALNIPMATVFTSFDITHGLPGGQAHGNWRPWMADYVVNVLSMIDDWDNLRGDQWADTKRDQYLTFLTWLLQQEDNGWSPLCGRPIRLAIGLQLDATPTYNWFDTIDEFFLPKANLVTLQNMTLEDDPFDSGVNLTVHGTTNTDVDPDQTVTWEAGNTVVQITGGTGFTTGFYGAMTSVGGGFFRLHTSPAAVSTAGGTWKHRGNCSIDDYLPDALTTTDLAKREGIAGAADVLTWLEGLSGNRDTLVTNTSFVGYAINWDDPSGNPPEPGSARRVIRRMR